MVPRIVTCPVSCSGEDARAAADLRSSNRNEKENEMPKAETTEEVDAQEDAEFDKELAELEVKAENILGKLPTEADMDARREQTLAGILEFGGVLEKHTVGKDDIKLVISIDREERNLEKLARLYGNRKGNPKVGVSGTTAELEEDAKEALDKNQMPLPLDGEGEEEEGETEGEEE